MANSPSSKKRALQAERRAEINKARRSRMRTFIRKVEEAIAAGDQAAAGEALKAAQPEIMRNVSQGRRPQEHREPQDLAPRRAGEGARRLSRRAPFRRFARAPSGARFAFGRRPRVPPSVPLSAVGGFGIVGVTERFLTAASQSRIVTSE